VSEDASAETYNALILLVTVVLKMLEGKIHVAALLIPVLKEFFLCFIAGRKKHFPGYHLVKTN
jgi:hypothetical protein